jgi:hypothetical protein
MPVKRALAVEAKELGPLHHLFLLCALKYAELESKDNMGGRIAASKIAERGA